MRLHVLFTFLFAGIFSMLTAGTPENKYRIEVELQHFDGDTLLLGYYFGKSQYLKDTAVLEKGKFVFEGSDSLKHGVYLIVIPPDNKFIHLLVSEDQPRMSMSVDLENIVPSAKFKGSSENVIYYDYLKALDQRRPLADSLKKMVVQDSLHKEKYQVQIDALDKEVIKIQDDVRTKFPESMTSMLIWANRDIEIPKYPELTEEERKQKQFEYYRAHYFDHFDLKDPRSLRSGIIHQKIDFFITKLSYQVPDSQSVSMDYVLGKMDIKSETFQYYLVYFLNEAAKSKRMGMDAVYVHLIDEYYTKGLATWTEKEQLDKLVAQAQSVRATLIGKIAPDLTFYKESGEPVSIHSIKSDYTVLFFWDPECGHCKKSIPSIIDFYNAYKDKGVEVLAICTQVGRDISPCWATIKERGMDIWVNAADQVLKSRYKTVYDVKTTPQIFILDKDKKIIAKKLPGEELKNVMDEITKVKQ